MGNSTAVCSDLTLIGLFIVIQAVLLDDFRVRKSEGWIGSNWNSTVKEKEGDAL